MSARFGFRAGLLAAALLCGSALGQTPVVGGAVGPAGPAGPAGAAGPGFGLPAAWSASATYAAYDVVTHLGSTYAALKASTGVVPGTDAASWALMAQKGNDGAAGANGANGAPGVPGYNPNSLASGGSPTWTSGFNFTVSAAVYFIGGAQHSSPQTNVTIAAPHATLDRIDVIAVNDAGAVVVVEGTAAETPAEPTVDPATQLKLTQVRVDHGQSAPTGVTVTHVYHENTGVPTEWDCTASGAGMAVNSTASPIAGTYDVLATAATTGQYVQCQAASPVSLAAANNLAFSIKSTAAWNSKRSVQIWFASTGARVGSIVTLSEGAFGFASASTSTQSLAVPLGLFGTGSTSVNQIRFSVAGSQTAIGFRLDDVTIQGGVAAATAPSFMSWTGAWNATASYPVNAVVRGADGNAYVALASNTNSAPTAANANWAQLSKPIRRIQFPVSGGGAAIALNTLSPIIDELPACEIKKWGVSSDASETVTVKFLWADAGTALPAAINTNGVTLTGTGTNFRASSTTLTDFTRTAIPVGSAMRMQVTAVTASQNVTGVLLCQE